MMKESSTLFLGVGNPWRNDDALGWVIGDKLKNKFKVLPSTIDIKSCIRECLRMIEAWEKSETLYVVDAIFTGQLKSGEIYRWNNVDGQSDLPLIMTGHTSGHSLGLGEALKLSRSLGNCPKKIFFWGVEIENCDHGENLSSMVKKSTEVVVDEIYNKLKEIN